MRCVSAQAIPQIQTWKSNWMSKRHPGIVCLPSPFTYMNLSVSSWLTMRLPQNTTHFYGTVGRNYSHVQNKSFSNNYAHQLLSLLPSLSGCWWLPVAVGRPEKQMVVIHEVFVSQWLSAMGLRWLIHLCNNLIPSPKCHCAFNLWDHVLFGI